MKKTMALFAAMALGTTLTVSAGPAYRGAIKKVQPDGTVITTFLRGDEHGHQQTTTDGYAIERGKDGYFHYVTQNTKHVLTTTGTPIVREISQRTAADRLFLEKTPKAVKLNQELTSRMPLPAKAASTNANASKVSFENMRMRQFPAKGKFKGLVILAQFQDAKFTYDQDYFNRMLNEEGFSDNGAHGSAHDYWYAQSNGQFDATFDVVGPVTLSQSYAYYGRDTKNIFGQNTGDADGAKAIDEAVRLADDQIDYSKYDLDNDGKVDMVYVIYAGYGENFGADANTIWPHQYELSEAGYKDVCDGKTVDTYACSAELYGSTGTTPCGIGPLCHEFGHVFGFADHYNTNSSTDYMLGEYDLMDYGAYNDSTRMPPSYTAFERMSLGWMQPKILTDPADGMTLPDIATSNEAYVIPTAGSNEYYLLENRQQNGWDKAIPGSGLMITHLDFDANAWKKNTVNTTSSHKRYYLVCADNEPAYDVVAQKFTEEKDLYPALLSSGTNDAFTDNSLPAAQTYYGGTLDRWVTDIKNTDHVVSFNYMSDYQKTPTGLTATQIQNDEFTAKWNADKNVDNYNLRWHRMMRSSEQPIAYTKGYTELNNNSMVTEPLNLSKYDGAFTVVVRAHSETGKQPVFTVSANGKSGKTRLTANVRNYIYHFDNGLTQTPVTIAVTKERALIDSIVVLRGDGSTLTDEGKVITVTGTAASTTNVEVDDPLIVQDTTLVEGLSSAQYLINHLEKDQYYTFEVQAVGNNTHKTSPWSQPYTVYTDAALSIKKVDNSDETGEKREFFTLSGQKISHAPQYGIYIEKHGQNIRKVLVR